MSIPPFKPRHTRGSSVDQTGAGRWRLSIPAGQNGYRLAQLDDYAGLPRRAFPIRGPAVLSLRARLSAAALPGTWGFGFWNDPFSAGFGAGGGGINLGALPNAAWVFHSSPPNYLSLRNDLPARGLLAGIFTSAPVPTLALAPAVLLGLPLLLLSPAARLLRRLGRVLVHEDAAPLALDPCAWHAYRLELSSDCFRLWLDEALAFETRLVPRFPLARVIWIDNQYAAFTPAGRLSSGSLSNPPAWMEIEF